ncbi:hypothetical protein LVD17_24085 [Fulvivirga ulvae]|uniref:hypothetical protein n=1 Tax=Fulvivirga ulvae TaxID=2904245 RepID=UPI001F395F73|nr:hypothetical protein [Fulvivirga ulvae]UII31377.1 hypothetical protein LVD17_24085 [Fulvivirga ulvae]
MRYSEFFKIEINHQYFEADEMVEMVMTPDASTLRLLRGQRFLVKPMINGIRILMELDDQGTPRHNLQLGDVLTFEVYPTSNTFHAFTEAPDFGTGEILKFTNLGLSKNETTLAVSVAEGAGSYKGFPIAAKVEITIDKALIAANAAQKYAMAFSAKSARWKYYFVSDESTSNLTIEDRSQQLRFKSVDLQNDTVDKIIMALRSNFPHEKLFLFESETPIAFRRRALKNLQLTRNEDVIISHLPNPDLKDRDFKIIQIK